MKKMESVVSHTKRSSAEKHTPPSLMARAKEWIHKPGTKVLGLYIATQHVAPILMHEYSRQLQHSSDPTSKEYGKFIDTVAIPCEKIAGYAYGSHLAWHNTQTHIHEEVDRTFKAHRHHVH
jgi:hypothetical protein